MARSHLSPDVATCRQTVEALLAPLPPLGSGWLRFVSGSNEYLPKQKGLLLHPPLSHKPPLYRTTFLSPSCSAQATGPCKSPVFWRRSATRNASAARRYAPSQHGRHRTPKQLARNAKNPGKTFGFAAERTGTELFDVLSMFLGFERYLLTSAYADNKAIAVASLGEYLDFQGSERDYKSIRSAEIA